MSTDASRPSPPKETDLHPHALSEDPPCHFADCTSLLPDRRRLALAEPSPLHPDFRSRTNAAPVVGAG